MKWRGYSWLSAFHPLLDGHIDRGGDDSGAANLAPVFEELKMMVRKGLLVSTFALGAILVATQAQASVIITSTSPIDVSGQTQSGSNTGSGVYNPAGYTFTYTALGSFFGHSTPTYNSPPTFMGQAPDYFSLPVAEPGTWAMMISGFAIIGLAMRRRVKSINFA
jgi:hypothetical protein